VVDYPASKEFALQVLGDIGGKVTSSGANTERREVNGHARISNWLGLTEYGGLVHPVRFSGICYTVIGGSFSHHFCFQSTHHLRKHLALNT
jgi:hypothetical protein